MIKIGIESTSATLRCDLLTHPARYFFILVVDGRASLCIRTCDSQGEDIKAHIIDGLLADSEGNLVSVFEEGVRDAMLELGEMKKHSCEGEEYPIASHLEWVISMMPSLIDWIMSSVLTDDRNIVIYPSWAV